MEVFEILFLIGFIIAIIVVMRFFVIKLMDTPQNVREKKIGKIEEYLKSNRKTVNDLDFFLQSSGNLIHKLLIGIGLLYMQSVQ